MATLTKKELQEKCRMQHQELARVRLDLRECQVERSKDKQRIAELEAKLAVKPQPKVEVKEKLVRARRVEDEAELARLMAKIDVLERELNAK